MLSNSTCTPLSVLLTVFPAPTLKLTPVAGPRFVPLIVISSPTAITPNTPLALLEMENACGTGTPLTITVTITVIGDWAAGVIVIVPVNVPVVVKTAGATETVNVNGEASPVVVVPVVGVTDSHPLG